MYVSSTHTHTLFRLTRMQRATEISFSKFAHHLHTNTIGPIITAQRLLTTGIPIGTIIFMSSDSGSALNFRDFEDGFGAYAASKAALNQMLRVCIHCRILHNRFHFFSPWHLADQTPGLISIWPQSFIAITAQPSFLLCILERCLRKPLSLPSFTILDASFPHQSKRIVFACRLVSKRETFHSLRHMLPQSLSH
jgi:short chain dehydrogenase